MIIVDHMNVAFLSSRGRWIVGGELESGMRMKGIGMGMIWNPKGRELYDLPTLREQGSHFMYQTY